MPCIHTQTNVAVTKAQEEKIKSRFGKAIELLGKSEHWLMLTFSDNCRMWFQGESGSPMAFVEIKLYGRASDSAYSRMTGEATRIVSEELGIAPDKIYVKYEEVAHWGYNGSNF